MLHVLCASSVMYVFYVCSIGRVVFVVCNVWVVCLVYDAGLVCYVLVLCVGYSV